jgi:hypothetical protein
LNRITQSGMICDCLADAGEHVGDGALRDCEAEEALADLGEPLEADHLAADPALLLLGFALAARRSQLVALDVGDLEECLEGLPVTIRRSKTDQEGAGAVVAVCRGSIACPVAAVRDWLAPAGISDGPVFRRVNSKGREALGNAGCRALLYKLDDEAAGWRLNPQLREKLRKIEALFAGAGTTGERLAAEAAPQRVRARLTELSHKDSPVETQFSCRRYGLSPYSLHRQRRNTVMVRAPRVSSIRFSGPSSASLIAACRPIFVK